MSGPQKLRSIRPSNSREINQVMSSEKNPDGPKPVDSPARLNEDEVLAVFQRVLEPMARCSGKDRIDSRTWWQIRTEWLDPLIEEYAYAQELAQRIAEQFAHARLFHRREIVTDEAPLLELLYLALGTRLGGIVDHLGVQDPLPPLIPTVRKRHHTPHDCNLALAAVREMRGALLQELNNNAPQSLREAAADSHSAARTAASKANTAWTEYRTGGAPLRGWHQILAAIEVDCDDPKAARNKREQLKKWNNNTDGPIKWQERTPEADRGELQAWIEDTHGRARAAQAQRESKKAATEELGEREGIRAQDHKMHTEKRPNARGKVR